jgi:hypothetical protein
MRHTVNTSGFSGKRIKKATMKESLHSMNDTNELTVLDPPVAIEPSELSAIIAGLGDEALPPPKFYRIGEVIQYSGYSRQTVHNYTAMGLIQESRWTNTGHRLYDGDVFRRLALIKQLKSRYSLAQIKNLFEHVQI